VAQFPEQHQESCCNADRPAIRVLPRASPVALIWGSIIGVLIWGLYSFGNSVGVTSSLLGHPFVDSLILGFLGSAPIAVWSALEVKRAGFDSLALVFRRSSVWFVRGGVVALVVLAAAIAGGAGRETTPRGIASEVTRFLVVGATVSACILAAANLIRLAVRRSLGMKTG